MLTNVELPENSDIAKDKCPPEGTLSEYLKKHPQNPENKGFGAGISNLKKDLKKEVDGVGAYYKTDNFYASFALNQYFEYCTLLVISVNAVWIGYDADENTGDSINNSAMTFVVAENLFCFYFTFELLIRFQAFERKRDVRRSYWFMFDLFLVLAMIFETWLLPLLPLGKGSKMLGLLRLFRLLRLTRMARLMRAFPEILTLVKGMIAAGRSVGVTLLLLVIILYLFGIVFVMNLGTDPLFYASYGTLPNAMKNLFLGGTLLDNITSVLKELKDNAPTMFFIYLIFILISSFTILNMLIGVLCEVASATQEHEYEMANRKDASEKLTAVFDEIDEDGTGTVSQKEFDMMKEKNEVLEALKLLDVESKHLLALSGALFEPDNDQSANSEPKELSFEEFLEVVCHMRPKNSASVLDICRITKGFKTSVTRLRSNLDLVEILVKKNKAKQEGGGSEREKVRTASPDLSPDQANFSKESEVSSLMKELESERRKAARLEETLENKRVELQRIKDDHK